MNQTIFACKEALQSMYGAVYAGRLPLSSPTAWCSRRTRTTAARPRRRPEWRARWGLSPKIRYERGSWPTNGAIGANGTTLASLLRTMFATRNLPKSTVAAVVVASSTAHSLSKKYSGGSMKQRRQRRQQRRHAFQTQRVAIPASLLHRRRISPLAQDPAVSRFHVMEELRVPRNELENHLSLDCWHCWFLLFSFLAWQLSLFEWLSMTSVCGPFQAVLPVAGFALQCHSDPSPVGKLKG